MERPPPWVAPDPLPLPLLTPRLRIDAYRLEDAEALHLAVSADRASLLPWLPWAADDHQDAEQSAARIAAFRRQQGFAGATDFVLAVFERATGALVGGTGFHRIEREEATAEIGYWIRGDRTGEGLCTEAAGALIGSGLGAWGFRRIRLVCAAANLASARVAEKLGLRLERRAREARYVEGVGFVDDLEYAVLATEWDAEANRGPLAPTRRTRTGMKPAKGFSVAEPEVGAYVERLLRPEDEVLTEIRERSRAAGLPEIAVGPADGRHLEVIARAAGARRIVEIGTLGGYSGVCLARALPPDGVLHTFELSPEHAEVARASFDRAGLAARVRIHVGPALERLRDVERQGPFDLVFIDADKTGYPDYLTWAERHVRPGGVLLADNVFRMARLAPGIEPSAEARAVHAFNERLASDGAWRATLLPLEDGLAFAVRVATDPR